MAKINDDIEYPLDETLTGEETVIGSDTDGSTKQYKLSELSQYFRGYIPYNGSVPQEVVTSGTDYTEMYSQLIPANTLANDGEFLEFEFLFSIDGVNSVSQNNLSYRFSFAGHQIEATGFSFASGGYANRLSGKIIRKSATSLVFIAQIYLAFSEYVDMTDNDDINVSVSNLGSSSNTFLVEVKDSSGKDSWTIYSGYLRKRF